VNQKKRKSGSQEKHSPLKKEKDYVNQTEQDELSDDRMKVKKNMLKDFEKDYVNQKRLKEIYGRIRLMKRMLHVNSLYKQFI